MRAPYGRRSADREGRQAQPSYQGQTYYERPALKASHWGWLIVVYFWVGGIAGASQVIAAVADLFGHNGDRVVVRSGRYLALAGSLASPVLLILDLHTPQRWFNMLRIFRRSSSMSIGSWTLSLFGTLSGIVAAAQAADDLLDLPVAGTVARAAGMPAAAAGAMMAIYTGSLLSTTSTPLWAVSDQLLPALFGAGAMTTGVAAVTLLTEVSGSNPGASERLDKLSMVAGIAELGLGVATDLRLRQKGVAGPLDEPPLRAAYRWGVFGLGMIVPLVLHGVPLLLRRRSRSASLLAAFSTLIGGFLLRMVLVFAGKESARRPRDYFRVTQPTADGQAQL